MFLKNLVYFQKTWGMATILYYKKNFKEQKARPSWQRRVHLLNHHTIFHLSSKS